MSRQIVKVIHNGTYTVTVDDTKTVNAYTIKKKEYIPADHKYRTRNLRDFDSLYGCMSFLADEVED